MKKTAFNLITWNNSEWTKEMLRTLEKYSNGIAPEVFCADNGSSEEDLNELKKVCKLVIVNKANIGVAYSRNQVSKIICDSREYEYMCCIHQDMAFTPNWIAPLQEELEKNPKAGKVGSLLLTQIDYRGIPDAVREQIAEKAKRPGSGFGNTDPWLMRCKDLQRIGYFDEQFNPQECEDVDYNARVEKAGLKVICRNDSVVFHKIGQHRLSLPEFRSKGPANRQKLKDKYPGEDPFVYNRWIEENVNIDGYYFIIMKGENGEELKKGEKQRK